MLEASAIPFFIGGRRNAFAKADKGGYIDDRPDDLLVRLIKELLNASDIEGFEDLIVGCAYPEGEQGYNMARTVALGCGLSVPGCTVNRLCGSSLEAIAIAASRIKSGWGNRFLVGGVESMTRIPRRGANFSESDAIKATNEFAYVPNGDTAENVVARYPNLDRESQEDFAARSHELAAQAYDQGKYSRQIYPFKIQRDEFIRVPVNREKMASLKPAFREDGVVTAATSSPLTDGATAGIVLSQELARDSQFENGLEILDVAVAHVEPELMGLGPVPATQMIFQRNGIGPDDISAVEINEAFAVQVLASIQELEIPLEKVNCWGGALAIGHPLGASGLRLMMTLHDRMAEQDEPGSLGLATLCVGGGQGVSVLCRYVKF